VRGKKGIVLVILCMLLLPVGGFAAGGKEAAPAPTDWMDISVAFWGLTEFGNDPVGKKISEDLKIRMKVYPLSWDDENDKVLLWAAADDLPDMLATYTVDQDINRFYSWIDEKLIRPIPEKIIEQHKAEKAIFDATPLAASIKQLKGGYYFIPRPGSVKGYYKGTQDGFYYRKDWAAKLGLKEPTSTEELYQMAKAFTEKDPDGNGKKDTGGLTLAGPSPTSCYKIFGIDQDVWVKEEGQWVPGFASKKNVEILSYYQKMYREGSLDPEFALNGYKQALQKLAQGSYGIVLRNADVYWINKTINRTYGEANNFPKDADGRVDATGVIGLFGALKHNGAKAAWPLLVETSGTEVSAKVSDEKLERIFMLHDYMLTPAFKQLSRYGVEGEDFDMVGGVPTPRKDPKTGADVAFMEKYPSLGLNCLTDWDFDNDIENPRTYPEPVRKLGEKLRGINNAAAMPVNLAVRLISSPAKDKLAIFGTWQESFAQIVVGAEDASTAFPKFVKEQMDKGMADAIKEVNAKAKETKVF
jgi:ABC-type glycerol-3-phosphate transport system substrate-binding protein